MHDRTSDDALARLETELRESRTQAWDVETFLAKRHQAKIDALGAPAPDRVRAITVAKELFWGAMMVVGYLTTLTVLFLWFVTGQFPLP